MKISKGSAKSSERFHEISDRIITESSEEKKKKVFFNIIENEEYAM